MKFITYKALLILTIFLCSHAIQIKEASGLSIRHPNPHSRKKLSRLARSTSADIMRNFPAVKNALKEILSRKNFSVTLSAVLNLYETINLPVSVTLFYDSREGEWDWTYSPSSQDLEKVIKAIQGVNLPKLWKKYKNINQLSAALVEFVEDVAVSFVKDLLMSLGKTVLVALFPFLAPIFAIWGLIEEVSNNVVIVELTGDDNPEKIPGLYKIGYSTTVLEKNDGTVGIDLLVEMTVRLGKLVEALSGISQAVLPLIENQYNSLPAPVKDVLAVAKDCSLKVAEEISAFQNALEKESQNFKKRLVQNTAAFFTRVKELKAVKLVLNAVTQLAVEANGIKNELIKGYSKFSRWTTVASATVKEWFQSSKNWLPKAVESTLKWFSTWFTRRTNYLHVFRSVNRRYFRLMRRETVLKSL